MPIYEYRCNSCGLQKEYIQRMSDAPMTDCPECKTATLSKMVTAAGFQLKGGGWYVTDFKGGGTNAAGKSKKTEEKQVDTASKSESVQTEKSKTETATSSTPAPSTTPASSSSS